MEISKTLVLSFEALEFLRGTGEILTDRQQQFLALCKQINKDPIDQEGSSLVTIEQNIAFLSMIEHEHTLMTFLMDIKVHNEDVMKHSINDIQSRLSYLQKTMHGVSQLISCSGVGCSHNHKEKQ